MCNNEVDAAAALWAFSNVLLQFGSIDGLAFVCSALTAEAPENQ